MNASSESIYQGLATNDTLMEVRDVLSQLTTALMGTSQAGTQQAVLDELGVQVAGDVRRETLMGSVLSALAAVQAALAGTAQDSSVATLHGDLTSVISKMVAAPALDATVAGLGGALTSILAKLPSAPALDASVQATTAAVAALAAKTGKALTAHAGAFKAPSTSAQTLIAANAARRDLILSNTTNVAVLFRLDTTTITTTNGTLMLGAGSVLRLGPYTGAVQIILPPSVLTISSGWCSATELLD